jgi:hypothetical protein
MDPVKLVIHEDGTLGGAGRDALHKVLPEAEIIDRASADERVDGELARYPLCRAARAACPLFLKLFDVALLESGELKYCDSDILCLRRFTGVFGPTDRRYRGCFMRDCKHAYAVRPWHLRPLGQLRLRGCVNTGLIRTERGFLQLELVEWLLKKLGHLDVWARRWYWTEQTCWAALASRGLCGLWDRRRAILASSDMGEYGEETAIIHFVSTYRHHLDAFAGRCRPVTDPPVEIASTSAAPVGPLGQFVSDLRARLGF